MAPGRCNNRDILTTKLGRVIAIEVLDRNDEPSFSRICDLLNNWERSTFETELTAALSRFFDSVRDATLATCVREGIRVTSVGITLPEQWPRAAAELFISVSRTTFLRTDTHFNVSRDDIHWSNETQALCHYILKDRAEMLQKYGSSGFPVVLADYARPNPVSSRHNHTTFLLSPWLTNLTVAEHVGILGTIRF